MIEKTIRPTPQIAAAVSSFLTDEALFPLSKRYLMTAANPANGDLQERRVSGVDLHYSLGVSLPNRQTSIHSDSTG